MKKEQRPDAWFALVLRTMTTEDIRVAITEETDGQKIAWLKSELKNRGGL